MNQLLFQKAKNQFTNQVKQRDGPIITKFVRNSINEMKNSEGHDFRSKPSDESQEGDSNG